MALKFARERFSQLKQNTNHQQDTDRIIKNHASRKNSSQKRTTKAKKILTTEKTANNTTALQKSLF
ncbi:hypothetical protein [Methylotenera sp.]|uniref:hypothetical protein n=1 Tax=Methylotenera sp. TaxID=2051956 RepID=UPI002487D678|nr:hypothetical protein [Methylotenera sp.]MDI1298415.1 hypothetical protein [Methylotenera sp.]